METSSQIVPPGRKSYNNIKTTHYGLIDWPNSTNNGDSGLKSPNILMNRKNSSHDSGVDSMNTNSSGMYIYSLLDNAHVHVPSLRIANFFVLPVLKMTKKISSNFFFHEKSSFVCILFNYLNYT